jgi:diguanylate cyclase (GGDEF)-like protein
MGGPLKLPKSIAARPAWRLGIVSRLTISFLGVAALILAANLVVQQGILVERTVQVSAPPPRIVAIAVPAPAPVHVDPVQLPAPMPAVAPAVLEAGLDAIAHFDQTLRARLTTQSGAIDTDYQQATANLNDAIRAITLAAEHSGDPKPAGHIRTELRTYAGQASTLIKTADARRAAEVARTAALDSFSARVKEALAGAWTIFGRVVSRESLVALSDDLDSLRQHSEVLQSAAPITAPQIAAVTSAEQRLQQTLQTNAAGFRRAQGDKWYQGASADLAQLITQRETSLRLAAELSQGSQDFEGQSNQLRRTLFKAASATIPGAAQAQPAPAVPSPQAAAPLAVSSAALPPAPRQQVLATHSFTQLPADKTSRRAIAWVSGAAAALMVFMCIGIVFSIIAPVKRLLRATAEIAAGKYSVRVASGGIAELDTLATAFNTMADELAQARQVSHQYQQGLEEKIQERTRRLQELSERDPLTGLPNRRHLFVLLNAALQRAQRGGHSVGVLFLDIDNFKYINDGLGHSFGDQVLVAMGERLDALARAYGFAARMGGDEFTVVIDCAASLDEIRHAGEAIVAAFHSPLLVEGRELLVSVSIGACAYPVHAPEAASLLKAADMALFHAKALGRSQLSVFTSDLQDVAAARFATEQGLRRAIERGEFELYFQPEIDAETLQVGLVETLIRWRPPSGELILPGAFLAVAEESGLAIEIGDWVLRSAISAASEWHHGSWPEARIAINVSPRQLTDGNFVDRLAALLLEFSLPARCVEIELTESVLQTGPATIDSLNRIRALGVAVALDDFGTGFSSLSSLELLPLTRVKLDRSLISAIHVSPRAAAIAEAIIGMCGRLGLEVTAEGVEEPEQFAYLVRQRPMLIQGFLLSRPLPRQEVVPMCAILKERARELLLTSREGPLTAIVHLAPSPEPTPRRIGLQAS